MNAHVNIERTQEGYQFNGLAVSGLAPRESQVLLLRAAGLSINECSRVLNCGAQAVKARMSNLFYKLHANNAPELIAQAFKSGFLRLLLILLAIHMGIATPLIDQRDALARAGRTRPRTTQRDTRIIRSDGYAWLNNTNTLA
jgi:DNA-binding CsgD family transcriptional regulator